MALLTVIEIPRGDARTLSLTVKTPDGLAFNLTGYKVVFTLGSVPTLAKKNVAAGGSDAQLFVTGAAAGTADIYISGADTQACAPGGYRFDVVVEGADGREYTAATGVISIASRVTPAIP